MERQCPVKDDNDVQCEHLMTKEEEKQDGMCTRCAELIWDWTKDMSKLIIFSA